MKKKPFLPVAQFMIITLTAGLAMTARAATVVRVAAGNTHSLFMMSDGSLWGMGDETYGELGQGFGLTQTNLPIQIVTNNVTAVACGEYHSMFVESDGSLWGMGVNYAGELGDGTNVNHYFPEEVVSSDVNAVAAGAADTLYRTSMGSKLITVDLLGMGDNEFGELGSGPTPQETPVVIQSTSAILLEVVAFASGDGDTFFVRFNGSLWGMGDNQYGELGNGGTNNQSSPVQVGSNVVAVSAGSYHTLFLESGGGLWGMGHNADGELGDSTSIDRHSPEQIGVDVATISAGGAFSLFIKTDGSLWSMGDNDFGQLGDGTTTNQHSPVKIVASNVVAVAAGIVHSLFIKADGSLWGMGANFDGQLGEGSYATMRSVPIRIVPPPPAPVLTGFRISGNNVTLNASNGLLGATYYVITSTNITVPSLEWAYIATNQLSGDGNFTIIATNAVIPGARQQFFGIRLFD